MYLTPKCKFTTFDIESQQLYMVSNNIVKIE